MILSSVELENRRSLRWLRRRVAKETPACRIQTKALVWFLLLGSISAIQATQLCQGPFDGTPFDCGFLYSGGVYTILQVPGAVDTFPGDINNNGEIVGTFSGSDSHDHGFLYRNGAVTVIDVPGASNTFATGINDSGEIVGTFQSATNSGQFFLDSSGVVTKINTPGAPFETSFSDFDINNAGQIVGSLSLNDGRGVHGFLDNAGSFVILAFPPGSDFTSFAGINDPGQIVGFGNQGGLIYSAGIFTTIIGPGGAILHPFGINNAGQIVGRSDLPVNNEFVTRGFLDTAGVFTTIGIPNSPGSEATGINDLVQIVGFSEDVPGPETPEPSTAGLVGGGLAAILAIIRRKYNNAWLS